MDAKVLTGERATVEPFDELSGAVRASLEAEAADLGRFLATAATVAIAEVSGAG